MPAALLDCRGDRVVPFAVVEVFYRGSWRRGRVVKVGRVRAVVEVPLRRRRATVESWRRSAQLRVVDAGA